jgi:hypothetical protein
MFGKNLGFLRLFDLLGLGERDADGRPRWGRRHVTLREEGQIQHRDGQSVQEQ